MSSCRFAIVLGTVALAGGGCGFHLSLSSGDGGAHGTVGELRAGALVGAVGTQPGDTDLTVEGRRDWVHFGWFSFSTLEDVDRKGTGGHQIDYSLVHAILSSDRDAAVAFSWTDGSPHAMANGSPTSTTVGEVNSGFSLTVPADTSEHTLRIYVGGASSGGTLIAELGDVSGPVYRDSSLSAVGEYHAVYTLTYHAASPGQTLSVRWTESADFGHGTLSLEAATLN